MFDKIFDLGRETVAGILDAFERVKKNRISKRTLGRMLFVECRHNIAVIEAALMSDEISELEGLWVAVPLLSNEVCRAIIFSYEESTDEAYFASSLSGEGGDACGNNVISIYTKIETLKTLCAIKEKGVQLSRLNWKKRIKNIQKACLEVAKSASNKN